MNQAHQLVTRRHTKFRKAARFQRTSRIALDLEGQRITRQSRANQIIHGNPESVNESGRGSALELCDLFWRELLEGTSRKCIQQNN